MLKKLFIELNKIEREMRRNGYEYPRGSQFFPSSIPHHLESKKEIVDYFSNELEKLEITSRKLKNWFREFKDEDLGRYRINLPDERELNDSFRNLTIPELHLFYQPINPSTGVVYHIRTIRNWFKNNPMLKPVVRLNGERYSRFDFERYLNEGGIRYNQQLTNILFEFVNSGECYDLNKSQITKEVKKKIIEYNNGQYSFDIS